MNKSDRYSLGIRVLHWFMALLIFGMLPIGWYMSDLDDSHPLKFSLINYHQSTGVLILALAAIRLALKLTSKNPELSPELPSWERKLASTTHGLFYAALFVMPLSGIVMTLLSGYKVPFFFIELPNPLHENKDLGKTFAEVHELLAWGIVGLTALHIGGIAKAWIFNRLNLIKRMI